MDALVSSSQVTMPLDQENASTFLFKSKHQTIRSLGAIELLELPVADIHNPQSLVRKRIDEAFQRAKSLGQENPILVGAIPFDVSKPARLLIPEWWESSELGSASPLLNLDDFNHWKVIASRSIPGFERFTSGVREAIQRFEKGQLDKVVLSRLLEIELDQAPDPSLVMENIMAQNPSAFHFRMPIEGGVLLGASPELLVRKEGGQFFSNPLAGSAKRSSTPSEDQAAKEHLAQSKKDHFEHKLVVDVMRDQLTPVCQKIQIPDAPSLINTPTMWHLSSLIEGQLQNHKTSALELACLIHPTPAMCGAPTEVAHQTIQDIEPHDRGYFSGMVGWCDSQGNGEWAVAIRCATIQESTVRLFAGAGIVADSDPESEWAETRAKFTTMLNAFGINKDIL